MRVTSVCLAKTSRWLAAVLLMILVAGVLQTGAAGQQPAAARVWLASLDLSAVDQGWGKPMVDKSVGGHPIALAGRKFEHGLGTHSPGAFVIDLDGGSRRFSAWVGIDDETAHRGSA